MRDYDKMELLATLQKMQALEKNTTKKNNILKVYDIVKRCNIATYKNITDTSKGVNLGNVLEVLVLRFYGLEVENNSLEVKSLVNNRANELTNANVQNVVFAVFSGTMQGLYSFKGSDICGRGRLGLKDLQKLESEKVATFSQMIKKINA